MSAADLTTSEKLRLVANGIRREHPEFAALLDGIKLGRGKAKRQGPTEHNVMLADAYEAVERLVASGWDEADAVHEVWQSTEGLSENVLWDVRRRSGRPEVMAILRQRGVIG